MTYLVIPNPVLPATLSHTTISAARSICVLECSPIQWHAQHNFAWMHSMVDIIPDSIINAKWGRFWIILGRIQIRLVP